MKHFTQNLRWLFMSLLLVVGVGSAWGDTITFDFEDERAHRSSGSNSYSSNSYEENGIDIALTYADAVTTGTPLSGSANITGRIAKNTTNSPTIVLGPITNSGNTISSITYKTKGVSTMTMEVSWSSDNSNWTSLQTLSAMPTSSTDESISNLSITASTFYLKFAVSVSSSTSSNRDFQLDNIVITYSSGTSGPVDPNFAWSASTATATIGESFSAPILSNSSDGAVTYSSSDIGVATIDVNGNVTIVAAGTTTITASVAATSNYNAATDSYTLKVTSATAARGDYEKVTSTADLTDGEYLIVYEEGSLALGSISNTSTKYGIGEEIIISDNTITITNEPVAVLTLGTSGTNYTFKSSINNEYLSWTSGNSLTSTSSVSDNSSWTLSFSDGNLIMQSAADNARKLQYNTGNPRFACYTSDQKSIALYKKGNVVPSITFSNPEVQLEYSEGGTYKQEATTKNIGNATVTYSSSNTNVARVANDGTISFVGVGTVIITASVVVDNTTYTSQYKLIITEPNINLFEKVTDASELVEGGKYLLLAESTTLDTYAYNGQNGTNNYASYVSVKRDNDGYEVDNGKYNAKVLTLESAGDGSWFIKDIDANKYLYYTGDGNNLYFGNKADNAKWNISVSPSLTEIENVNTPGKYIRYNNTNSRFSCYGSIMTMVSLYKKAKSTQASEISFDTDYLEIFYGDNYIAPVLQNPQNLTPIVYSSSNPSVVSVDPTSGKITIKTSGGARIFATFYGDTNNKKAMTHYDIIVKKLPNEGLLFNETFDKLLSIGGNDGGFTGEQGQPYTRSNGWAEKKPNFVEGDDIDNWDSAWETDAEWYAFDTDEETDETKSFVQAAFMCAKFGGGNANFGTKADGLLTTSSIDFGDIVNATLTFSAAGWGTNWNDGTNSQPNKLTVTATNCDIEYFSHSGNSTVDGNTITLENGVWNDFTFKITNITGAVKISFKGYRGYLDEIAVSGPYKVTIGSTGWASLYYGTAPLTIPSNITAYTVHTKEVNGYTDVELSSEITEGTNIAAGMGVVLHGEPGDYYFNYYFGTDATTDATNILEGTDLPQVINDTGYEYFVLSKVDGVVGFYHQNPTYGKYISNGAHKAFFRLPEGTSILNDNTSSIAQRGGFSLDDMVTTAIESVENENNLRNDNVFYNLSGQRVSTPTKGIYIVNGKKVLIK